MYSYPIGLGIYLFGMDFKLYASCELSGRTVHLQKSHEFAETDIGLTTFI